MRPNLPIELEVDFRDFRNAPDTPEEFVAFWERLSTQLVGKPLRDGVTHEVEHPRDGVLRLTVLALPPGQGVVGRDTTFAVHSVLERPRYRHLCARCSAAGQQSHGAYSCPACGGASRPDRLCDRHVVILNGGMRLDGRLNATCEEHVPACRCGGRASFWCAGPRCRRASAWCERHRRQHPNAPDVFYCVDCYEELFPACAQPRCAFTATAFCEFVGDGGASCGRRMCSKHILRWQIYGPHKMGLGLCDQHRQVGRLDDDRLVFQLVAATANRKLRAPRSRQDLPSLQSVHHILLKVRQRAYGIPAIDQLFVRLEQRTGRAGPLERAMSELLQSHARFRSQNVARDVAEKQQGLPVFERLRALLRAKGWGEIADAVVFSDYKPAAKTLYIRLPQELRGRMIGKGGRTIQELGQQVGAKINFEKGE
ncbi:MAG TPA: KH domain-containing protein [Pyrinomonadaceae bacterium]|nr:KH domain-containing protein [Pyrinomonadaceae bacterium]